MLTRSQTRVLLLVLIVAASATALWDSYFDRAAKQKGRPGQSFVGLEELVASEVKAGWQIAAPPRAPGPYRRSDREPSFVGADNSMILRSSDKTGAVEEVRLEPDSAFDRQVIFLDTESGGQTLVVLRRPR